MRGSLQAAQGGVKGRTCRWFGPDRLRRPGGTPSLARARGLRRDVPAPGLHFAAPAGVPGWPCPPPARAGRRRRDREFRRLWALLASRARRAGITPQRHGPRSRGTPGRPSVTARPGSAARWGRGGSAGRRRRHGGSAATPRCSNCWSITSRPHQRRRDQPSRLRRDLARAFRCSPAYSRVRKARHPQSTHKQMSNTSPRSCAAMKSARVDTLLKWGRPHDEQTRLPVGAFRPIEATVGRTSSPPKTLLPLASAYRCSVHRRQQAEPTPIRREPRSM